MFARRNSKGLLRFREPFLREDHSLPAVPERPPPLMLSEFRFQFIRDWRHIGDCAVPFGLIDVADAGDYGAYGLGFQGEFLGYCGEVAFLIAYGLADFFYSGDGSCEAVAGEIVVAEIAFGPFGLGREFAAKS